MDLEQPYFLNHLRLAHHFWDLLLCDGDWALDATCGNGHDSAFLNERVERLFCMDIQPSAIEATAKRVPEAEMILGCHSELPDEAFDGPLKLICYNLGYLPGGDKGLTTQLETTKASMLSALDRMDSESAVSVTFYPGHDEGLREYQALLPMLQELDPKSFCVSYHTWPNRNNAPALAIILKLK